MRDDARRSPLEFPPRRLQLVTPQKREMRAMYFRVRTERIPGFESFVGKAASPRQYKRFRKLVMQLQRETQREVDNG